MKKKNYFGKYGFTLAEVLITLSIIGVVTAITLPLVINKTQKFVLKQQFKKSVNILSNAVRKTYADMEYTPHCSYGLNDGTNNGTSSECRDFNNILIKNLKIIKYCPNKAFENGCIADIKGIDTIIMDNDSNLSEEEAINMTYGVRYFQKYKILNNNQTWVLQDGQILMPFHITFPLYLVDINGLKGPNKWGYDIYTFSINKYKLICAFDSIEQGGVTCSKLMTNP